MTIKTLLSAVALTAVSATASFAYECNWGKEQVTMTCASGTVYDADTNSCKVVTG